MYRIFILSLLAIVFSTFALEPSQVILRAIEIRGDTLVLEWSPIEGAKTYKVFYDGEDFINPKAPEPILESPSTDTTRIEIQKMMDGTAYYLIVHGFDEKGVKIGETLPLHASTLRNPVFALKTVKAIDDQNISLTFSHPIDLKKTEIELVNTETKKPRATKNIIVSKDDLRIVEIHLEGKLAADVSHDVVLKKITNTSGIEMLSESKKTFTVMFSTGVETSQPVEDIIPVAATTEENKQEEITPLPEPDASLDALEKETEELGIDPKDPLTQGIIISEAETIEPTPVSIDKLPKTGSPAFLFLALALLSGAGISYKKKVSL